MNSKAYQDALMAMRPEKRKATLLAAACLPRQFKAAFIEAVVAQIMRMGT